MVNIHHSLDTASVILIFLRSTAVLSNCEHARTRTHTHRTSGTDRHISDKQAVIYAANTIRSFQPVSLSWTLHKSLWAGPELSLHRPIFSPNHSHVQHSWDTQICRILRKKMSFRTGHSSVLGTLITTGMLSESCFKFSLSRGSRARAGGVGWVGRWWNGSKKHHQQQKSRSMLADINVPFTSICVVVVFVVVVVVVVCF